MEAYYAVAPLSDDPAEPDSRWFAEFRKSYPCLHRFPETAIDVVVSHYGENVALNCIQGVGNLFGRIDLLEALGEFVEEYLSIGRLLDVSMQPLEDFRTLGSNLNLTIRGGPKSTRQFCAQCGQFLYYPMGKQYVLKSDLTGQPLYYGDVSGLVVNERLCRRLRSRHWSKIDISELPILEEPRDGLPLDLSVVKPSDL